MLSAVDVLAHERPDAPRDPDRACGSVVTLSISKNADCHRTSCKVIKSILSQTRFEATGLSSTANVLIYERTSPHLMPHRTCGGVVARSISKNANFGCF